jgi:hypothetical protein
VAKLGTVTFTGASGKSYKFNVYSWDTSFNAVAGVYAITKRYKDSGGGYKHKVVYVGETGDLSGRFDAHHKADCFERENANCKCTYREDTESTRQRIERDLIEEYDPECND